MTTRQAPRNPRFGLLSTDADCYDHIGIRTMERSDGRAACFLHGGGKRAGCRERGTHRRRKSSSRFRSFFSLCATFMAVTDPVSAMNAQRFLLDGAAEKPFKESLSACQRTHEF